jgi:hypothetical protein
MSELEQLRKRIAELEQRVRELEARPREYHYHAPLFIPYTPPSSPVPEFTPSKIYIGDPIPLPWNTTSGLPITLYTGDRYQ